MLEEDDTGKGGGKVERTRGRGYAFNFKYREERPPIDFMQIKRGRFYVPGSNNTFMGSRSAGSPHKRLKQKEKEEKERNQKGSV